MFWKTYNKKAQSVGNIDESFDVVPPYSNISLSHCLGFKASWEERKSFLRFLYNVLKTMVINGEKKTHIRINHLSQLAKANRDTFIKEVEQSRTSTEENSFDEKIGLSEGFISIHRTEATAVAECDTIHKFGEEAHIISSEAAAAMSSHVSKIPIYPLYFVYRPNDRTANCAEFVRSMIRKIMKTGINYRNDLGAVETVERIQQSSVLGHKKFRVNTASSGEDYDYLILAAGIYTPLLAAQIGAGKFCPIYPMRGHHVKVNAVSPRDGKSGHDQNLLGKSMIIDHIHISSVSSKVARFTGFGELVGYPSKAVTAKTVGPHVLSRYARALFPNENDFELGTALSCFRPMSPDELPIVGAVNAVPGLFIHGGHGTLGWTTSLATAECLAQDIDRSIKGKNAFDYYTLPNNSTIPSKALSPNRF